MEIIEEDSPDLNSLTESPICMREQPEGDDIPPLEDNRLRRRTARILKSELKVLAFKIAPSTSFIRTNFSTASKLSPDDLTLKSLITSMKKKPTDRNVRDLSIIIKFLNESE